MRKSVLLFLTVLSGPQISMASEQDQKRARLITQLNAISPLDGRYGSQLIEIAKLSSEAALIRYRIRIEGMWLLHLSKNLGLQSGEKGVDLGIDDRLEAFIKETSQNPTEPQVIRVKELEETCNHDVKAVEYFWREVLEEQGASQLCLSFIHFACTSEDITNLSYALMLKDLRDQKILPAMDQVQKELKAKVTQAAGMAMLAHTHGQAATPTTMGKELAVLGYRLKKQRDAIAAVAISGKINGAVGCYSAHLVAFPDFDWQSIAKDFVENIIGVKFNPLTTQIENHDYMVRFAQELDLYNAISIGLCQDIWTYISKDYFTLQVVAGEVGSSTMPHKVNPIDFENAEGNFGLASGLGEFFARKLPISRMQRDLSDSTVQRSLGSMMGYHLLAQRGLLRGLKKINANEKHMREDLQDKWQLLSEPLQTLLRKAAIPSAYEELKELTRGKELTREDFVNFVKKHPELDQTVMDRLSPLTYLGNAKDLALAYANDEI